MKQVTTSPRELLSNLIEIEVKLKTSIENHCAKKEFLEEPSTTTIDDFLLDQNLSEEDMDIKISELALLSLNKELDKAMAVIIDVNNLRAYYDYQKHCDMLIVPEEKQQAPDKKLYYVQLLIGAVIGVAVSMFVFYVL